MFSRNILRALVLASTFFVYAYVMRAEQVQAIDALSYGLLRFDSVTAGQNPGKILVEFQSSDAATESFFSVTLDTEWVEGVHFSGNPSLHTTSTAGLPQGFLALPLVQSEATAVAGNTIFFSIADLQANTKYAFYLNASGTGLIANPSASDQILHSLSTWDSQNALLAQVEVPVGSVTNQAIAVQAQVGAKTTDFAINLATADGAGPHAQNTQLQYEITYDSLLQFTSPVTVVARWSQGRETGSGLSQFSTLTYVVGSATTSPYGAAPVIDILNRTITWNLTAVPAGATGEVLQFSLETTENYQGASELEFDVIASIVEPVQTAEKKITQNYRYVSPPITDTPSPSVENVSEDSSPTSTFAPSATLLVPIVPSDGNQKILSVELVEVHATSASITVALSAPSRIQLEYGANRSSLSGFVRTSSSQRFHTIKLDNLLPQTSYFFTVAPVETNSPLKEFYYFKTARVGGDQNSSLNTVIMQYEGFPLFVSDQFSSVSNFVKVVPRNFQFDLQLAIADYEALLNSELLIRQWQVLGSHSENVRTQALFESQFLRLQSGRFFGRFTAPKEVGRYSIYVRLRDKFGAQYEKFVLDVIVSEPAKVLDNSQVPIEHARLVLSRFNENTQLFEEIPKPVFGYSNPSYSDTNGLFSIAFPHGRYLAEVSSAGFRTQSFEFTVDESLLDYPVFVLQYSNWDFDTLFNFILSTLDILHDTAESALQVLVSSRRLQFMWLLASGGLSVFLGFLSLSIRLRLPLYALPWYLFWSVRRLVAPGRQANLQGVVRDSYSQAPVVGAKVLAIDGNGYRIVDCARTNLAGFYELHLPAKVKLVVLQAHFHGMSHVSEREYSAEAAKAAQVQITMERIAESEGGTLRLKIYRFIFRIIEFSLEVFILLSLFFEVMLWHMQGFLAAVPYLAATSLVVFGWLYDHALFQKYLARKN